MESSSIDINDINSPMENLNLNTINQQLIQSSHINVIIHHNNISYKSLIFFQMIEYSTLDINSNIPLKSEIIQSFFWHIQPELIGCHVKFIQSYQITSITNNSYSIIIQLTSMTLNISFLNEIDYNMFLQLLQSIEHLSIVNMKKLKTMETPIREERNHAIGMGLMAGQAFEDYHLYLEYELAMQYEKSFVFIKHLKYKESVCILEKYLLKKLNNLTRLGFTEWIDYVKVSNDEYMINDRNRWRLHTASNLDNDLQAWYHTLFYLEVYRLRGFFWYRDAVLPMYRTSYSIINSGQSTQLEESVISSLLCSPDTTYGDAAGQMYVVQEITTPEEYTLFQTLGTHGVEIIKYPRMGRPAKKLFRFSFVEGRIYFTWKGKQGNQGISLGDISGIRFGISTDILKRTGSSSKVEKYLSLICSGRSIDICLENEKEREILGSLLEKLHNKEKGTLHNIQYEYPIITSGGDSQKELEALVVYGALSKSVLSEPTKKYLLTTKL